MTIGFQGAGSYRAIGYAVQTCRPLAAARSASATSFLRQHTADLGDEGHIIRFNHEHQYPRHVELLFDNLARYRNTRPYPE